MTDMLGQSAAWPPVAPHPLAALPPLRLGGADGAGAPPEAAFSKAAAAACGFSARALAYERCGAAARI